MIMWEQLFGGMLIGGCVCWRGLYAQWQVAGRLDAARRETVQKLREDIDALPKCPDPPPPPPLSQSQISPEVCKLLDLGWKLEIYKNDIGSYTVEALHKSGIQEITDDFMPGKAVDRIVDKLKRRGDYEDWHDVEDEDEVC